MDSYRNDTNMDSGAESETEGTDDQDTALETSNLSKRMTLSTVPTSLIVRLFPSFVARPGIRRILANASWLSGERIQGVINP